MPTADVCDMFLDDVSYVDDIGFVNYGTKLQFGGEIATAKCYQEGGQVDFSMVCNSLDQQQHISSRTKS